MEAQVIWSQLLELAATEQLWDAQVYSAHVNYTYSSSDIEELAEMTEKVALEPETQVYQLAQTSSDVSSFLAQSLKDKLASARLRALRPYDYLGDGKNFVMFFDLEEHNELFQDLVKTIQSGEVQATNDIELARSGRLFLVQHDLELEGKKYFCLHGRKIFPRRLARRIHKDMFPTVGIYFQDGGFKAAKTSYFEFDEEIDFLLVGTKIFIFNKFYFEQSTQFSSKMYEQTDEAFREIAAAVFSESEGMLLDLLTENPKKIRRKLSKIKQNEEALYKLPHFMERFEQVNGEEHWGYAFEKDESGAVKLLFPYTDEQKIDALFTILNDGRLYSKLTHRSYEAQQKREISREN